MSGPDWMAAKRAIGGIDALQELRRMTELAHAASQAELDARTERDDLHTKLEEARGLLREAWDAGYGRAIFECEGWDARDHPEPPGNFDSWLASKGLQEPAAPPVPATLEITDETYQNRCVDCGVTFLGPKRSMVCHKCIKPAAPQPEKPTRVRMEPQPPNWHRAAMVWSHYQPLRWLVDSPGVRDYLRIIAPSSKHMPEQDPDGTWYWVLPAKGEEGKRLVDERVKELQSEISGLRAGCCAHDQKTTQYCAESAALVADRAAIKAELEDDFAERDKSHRYALHLEREARRKREAQLDKARAKIKRLRAAAIAFHREIAPLQQPGIDWLDAQISLGALEEFEVAFGIDKHSQGEEGKQ